MNAEVKLAIDAKSLLGIADNAARMRQERDRQQEEYIAIVGDTYKRLVVAEARYQRAALQLAQATEIDPPEVEMKLFDYLVDTAEYIKENLSIIEDSLRQKTIDQIADLYEPAANEHVDNTDEREEYGPVVGHKPERYAWIKYPGLGTVAVGNVYTWTGLSKKPDITIIELEEWGICIGRDDGNITGHISRHTLLGPDSNWMLKEGIVPETDQDDGKGDKSPAKADTASENTESDTPPADEDYTNVTSIKGEPLTVDAEEDAENRTVEYDAETAKADITAALDTVDADPVKPDFDSMVVKSVFDSMIDWNPSMGVAPDDDSLKVIVRFNDGDVEVGNIIDFDWTNDQPIESHELVDYAYISELHEDLYVNTGQRPFDGSKLVMALFNDGTATESLAMSLDFELTKDRKVVLAIESSKIDTKPPVENTGATEVVG